MYYCAIGAMSWSIREIVMAFKKYGKGEVVTPTEGEKLKLEYEAMAAAETDEDRRLRRASANKSHEVIARRIREENEE